MLPCPLLAPAKTFEVFEQQGNTFAFYLTCLWRPLKCIIEEQHRSSSHSATRLNHLPSKGTFSVANASSGKNEFGPVSLSPSLLYPSSLNPPPQLAPFVSLPPISILKPPCSCSATPLYVHGGVESCWPWLVQPNAATALIMVEKFTG